jgi:hypothetical protein
MTNAEKYELTEDQLDEVFGGTAPKTTTTTTRVKTTGNAGLFEIDDFSFDIEQ